MCWSSSAPWPLRCYRWENNTFIQLKEVCAITPEAIVSSISEPTIFTGDGVKLYKSFLKENLGKNAQFAAPELQFVSPMAIARLGMDKFKSGNFESSNDIEPVYIRNFVPNVKI